MALFKPLKGTRASLDSQPLHDGYAYFCVDDGSFHIDYTDADGNLQRKQLNAKDAETVMGITLAELQPDWTINDETSPAYIKNRPFYTTDPQEIELCNGTYSFSEFSSSGLTLYRAKIDADSTYFVDEIGQEVRIIYDGTTYDLTSKYISAMDTYYVGNGSLFNDLGSTEEDTGEPFAYTLGAYFFTSETDAQHTIKIYINKVTDITIPHKYIGLNVWTGDGKDSVVANNADNVASGYRAFAIGLSTTASGSSSHAEGSETVASGDNSHAEGNDTIASNFNSHAEGCETVASGHSAHAEGVRTEASGQGSHTEGQNTKASAWNAHAEGQGTEAASKSQHVFGEYNIVDKSASVAERGKYIQIAGNGGSENAKSNAYTLAWDGTAWFASDVKIGGTGQDDVNTKTLATTDYVDSKVAHPDWNQNDSTADDYIKNRTHWLEKEERIVEFNGDLTGREYVQFDDGVYLIKMSDKILTEAETIGSTLRVNALGEIEEVVLTADNVFIGDNGGSIIVNDVGWILSLVDADGFSSGGTFFVGTSSDSLDSMWVQSISCLTEEGSVYHQLDEGFIPDTIARKSDIVQSEQVQPDQNQNDSTAVDYIKNRTHWLENILEVIIPTTTDIYINTNEQLPTGPYVVTLDGIKYECTAYYKSSGRIVLGHERYDVNQVPQPIDPPFYIESYLTSSDGLLGGGDDSTNPIVMIWYGDSEDHTIEIAKVTGVEYHQLDEGFIPDTIARKSDIGNIDLSNYYTKTEIDNLELITVEDIDAICGTVIQLASETTF